MTPAVSKWVLGFRNRPEARLRLFCFPYAGAAGSAYRAWVEAFGPEVEVLPLQLPGRGARFPEPAARRLDALAPAVTDGLLPLLDKPFAFFGHSMGAFVAFEVARELRRRQAPGPVLLAVSGRQAPSQPEPRPPYSHLPDPEFLAEVVGRYGGIPPEILAEKELLRLLLPALRADVQVLESYAYRPEAPLACDIAAFGGTEDVFVTRPALEAWRQETAGDFAVHTFPGGHFFIDSAREAVLDTLRARLQAEVAS